MGHTKKILKKKKKKKKIETATNIVLTMIGISNSNKTSYQNGCQSRTDAYI
jgi:hypothetical protein